jgi:hypothetical protein
MIKPTMSKNLQIFFVFHLSIIMLEWMAFNQKTKNID